MVLARCPEQTLIKSVLETAGPAFRGGEKFSYAIKQYLCLSLLKNSLSPFDDVFKISMEIFDNLVLHFIDHLKGELSQFFDNIFFRFIESPSSSYFQKSVVLSTVQRMCAGARFPVDLYLNYDCDFEGTNVFERLVKSLSDMARGHEVPQVVRAGLLTVEQGQQLQLQALGALVTCVCSMVEWCRMCDAEEEQARAKLEGPKMAVDADEDEDLEALIEKERGGRPKVGIGEQAQQAENAKRRKEMVVDAVEKFNNKPKNGILFLQKSELVPSGTGADAAKKVAQLFRETEGFDKTVMGDYMGEGGTPKTQFNVLVLHAFIDTYDFRGMTFSESLRALLKGFRLPGEAQKIDRVVEKFAERFCTDNPGAFDNADAAYTLAYSVIMLNTDRHNPMVKKKMELADFLRNNRGINGDGGDLPAEMLEEIFHDIVGNEIKMKDDSEDWSKHSGMLTAKQRQTMWQDESDRISKQLSSVGKERRDSKEFKHAVEKHHVSLMFKASWAALLAAFSVIMEECDDPEVIELCLRGFSAAVHIGCTFFMEAERDAFISTLAKFTLLHTSDKMMQDKNVEAIKVVLAIAYNEGDYLEASWGLIQRSISQLDKKHLLLDGARDDASFFAGVGDTPRRGADPAPGSGVPARPTAEQQQQQREYQNALPLLDQIDRNTIDRVYANSSALNSEAVIHFVTHLCEVSADEVAGGEPRVFSMEKIVETAAANMGRVRIVWGKIWKILQLYFSKVGCHENSKIGMYAIDSLRQLATKFLEKDELSGFGFQQEFLWPFEQIVANSKSSQIRELVVCCLDQMIQLQAKNLKSGWKALLKVLVLSANDEDEMIVNLGFRIAESVLDEHFAEIKDVFADMSHCIVAFGCNKTNTTVSLAAIRHLRTLSQKLTSGDVIPLPAPSQSSSTSRTFLFTEEHASNWFPLLTGIANLVNDQRASVRTTALETLFHMLRQHGETFSEELWKLIFSGVLIPIFDNVRHAGEDDEETEQWLQGTCFHALQALVDLFVHFYDIVAFLLGDVVALLTNCAEQERENLARIGVACFTRLCVSSGQRMLPEVWSTVTDTYAALFENTAPKELLLRTEDMDAEAASAAAAADSARQEAAAKAAEAAEVRQVYEAKMVELEAMARDEQELLAVQEEKRREVQEEARRAAELLQTLEAAAEELEATAERATARREKMQSERCVHLPCLGCLPASIPESIAMCNFREQMLRFRGVRCKCVVQLLLIDSVEEVFFKHGHLLRATQIVALLDALTRCHEFARDFNADIELRNQLWSQGFMKKVPNLLKQAGNGIACALRVLFRLYTSDRDGADAGAGGEAGQALPPEEVAARQTLAEGCAIIRFLRANRPVALKVVRSQASGLAVLGGDHVLHRADAPGGGGVGGAHR